MSGLYVSYKNACLGNGTLVDLDSDTIKVTLVDQADYTVNLSTHDFWNDVKADFTVGGANVATATLADKTVANGAFDSGDPTFTSVSGDIAEHLLLWKDTTVTTTSALIAYYDSFSAGMPVTPNGGNIVCTVNGSGWFSL